VEEEKHRSVPKNLLPPVNVQMSLVDSSQSNPPSSFPRQSQQQHPFLILGSEVRLRNQNMYCCTRRVAIIQPSQRTKTQGTVPLAQPHKTSSSESLTTRYSRYLGISGTVHHSRKKVSHLRQKGGRNFETKFMLCATVEIGDNLSPPN